MKPAKVANMFQELYLLTLSPAQWTQFEWDPSESYSDLTISFTDSLEQETIMLKVTILKVNIISTLNKHSL